MTSALALVLLRAFCKTARTTQWLNIVGKNLTEALSKETIPSMQIQFAELPLRTTVYDSSDIRLHRYEHRLKAHICRETLAEKHPRK